MKSISIGSGIAVPSFDVPTTDPNYWLLFACYEEVLFAERCYAEGVTADFVESTDISQAEAAVDSLSTYLKAWLASAMGAAMSGQEIPEIQESYIPELIEFLALAVTGQWGLIFVLFVKVGLKFMLERLKERIGSGIVDDTAGTLSEIFLDKTDPLNVVNRLDVLNQIAEGGGASEVLGEIFLDKTDPLNVKNRLDALNQLIVLNPIDVEIDSTDWDFYVKESA